MPDYSKGKIYKLHILGNDTLVYYGSTTTRLSDRIAKHRARFKRWKNGKGNYYTSFKLFENEKVVITLVENYLCNSKYELEARERWYIENNKCINKRIPTRTRKEYYQKNADKIIKQTKEYNKKNADKIKKYRKEYNKKNADKIKEYYEKNADEIKERQREYNKKNADKIKEYQQKYKKANADKLKQKIKCEFCSCSVRKNNLKRHHKTIKCKKFQ